MIGESLLFWRRHMELTKDNLRIVINYNWITGRMNTAYLLKDDILVENTNSTDVVKGWAETYGDVAS